MSSLPPSWDLHCLLHSINLVTKYPWFCIEFEKLCTQDILLNNPIANIHLKFKSLWVQVLKENLRDLSQVLWREGKMQTKGSKDLEGKEKGKGQKKRLKTPFFRNNPTSFQWNQPAQSGTKPLKSSGKSMRLPLKCRGCGEEHV